MFSTAQVPTDAKYEFKHLPNPTKNYEYIREAQPLNQFGHIHIAFEVRKPPKFASPNRNHKIWIGKIVDSPFEQEREVIAQEFLRFFLPHQPKTRGYTGRMFMTNNQITPPHYWVLSEKIPRFNNFNQSNVHFKYTDTNCIDLCVITFLSRLLNEYDLNLGNIGLGKNERLIKIDGGMCLEKTNPIFSNDLSYPITSLSHEPHNWLDIVMKSKRYEYSSSYQLIENHPKVRHAIFKVALGFLILPDSFLQAFTCSYSHYARKNTQIKNILIDIRDRLWNAALGNVHFYRYLLSEDAKADIPAIWRLIHSFTTMENCVLTDYIPDLESQITDRFTQLRNSHFNIDMAVNDISNEISHAKYDIAKELLNALPNKNVYWSHKESKNAIHLATQLQDMSLIRKLAKSGTCLGNQNNHAQTELEIAVRHHFYEAVEFFIEQHQDRYTQHQLYMACNYLMNEEFPEKKYEEKINIRLKAAQFVAKNCSIPSTLHCQRELFLHCVFQLLANTSSPDEVCAMVKSLDALESKYPLIKVRVGCGPSRVPLWKGESVSNAWMSLMESAKKRILVLSHTCTAKDDNDVVMFLKTPTRRPYFFSCGTRNTTAEFIQYQEYKHAQKNRVNAYKM